MRRDLPGAREVLRSPRRRSDRYGFGLNGTSELPNTRFDDIHELYAVTVFNDMGFILVRL